MLEKHYRSFQLSMHAERLIRGLNVIPVVNLAAAKLSLASRHLGRSRTRVVVGGRERDKGDGERKLLKSDLVSKLQQAARAAEAGGENLGVQQQWSSAAGSCAGSGASRKRARMSISDVAACCKRRDPVAA